MGHRRGGKEEDMSSAPAAYRPAVSVLNPGDGSGDHKCAVVFQCAFGSTDRWGTKVLSKRQRESLFSPCWVGAYGT